MCVHELLKHSYFLFAPSLPPSLPPSKFWLHRLERQRVGAKPCKSFQAFLIGKISRSSIEFRNLLRLIPVKPLLSRGVLWNRSALFNFPLEKLHIRLYFCGIFQCVNVVVLGLYNRKTHLLFCPWLSRPSGVTSISQFTKWLFTLKLFAWIHSHQPCGCRSLLEQKNKRDKTGHERTRWVWTSYVSHRTWWGHSGFIMS